MNGVGGNTRAQIQVSTHAKNEIGERVPSWETVQELTGWLDYQSQATSYETYGGKLEAATHVFVADYVPLDPRITVENSRLMVNGVAYDVLTYDDPMGLHYHWEIELQMRGGQNG